MTSHIKVIAVIATVSLLSACSSHRGDSIAGGTQPSSSESTTAVTPAISTVAESYLYSLSSTYSDWSTLVLPVDFELASPRHVNLRGKVYMERGKSIYISLRVLGMEMATVYVTNDMIYASEKLHKYYIAESVKDLLAGYDFTVANLQDLLLGRAFVAGADTLTPKIAADVKITPVDDGSGNWTLTPPSLRGLDYQFNIAPNPQHLRSLEVMPKGYNPVTCYYSQPTRTKLGGVLANVVTVKARPRNMDVQVNLTWDINSAKWDSGDIRQWKEPKDYTRLTRADLMKLFTSMN